MIESAVSLEAFDAFAVPAHFHRAAGGPITTRVIVDDLEVADGFETRIIENGALVTAPRDDVDLPKRGERFTVSGEEWRVEARRPSLDPVLVVCECRRN